MSRLSVAKNITRGVLQSQRLVVRCLSDASDSSCDLQRLRDKLSRIELDKASGQASPPVMWPHVKPMDISNSEFNDSADDGINAALDFKNNELDIEQVAGLPSPSDAIDPYISMDFVGETDNHRDTEDELQFGRIRALQEQLRQEIFTHEPYTEEDQSSLASMRANVDFMMQELGQIATLLKTLYHDQANNAISSVQNAAREEDNIMGSANTYPQDAGLNTNQEMNDEMASSESQAELESPVMSPESGQLSSDQETLDVIAADDSPKSTPTKPYECSPQTDARQDTRPSHHETIPTYRPFRTIQLPDTKPSQSPSGQLNAEEAPVQEEAAIKTEASELGRGFTISTQLPDSESRFLMSLALKQALKDLEAGKNHYKATMLMTEEDEQHGVD